MQKFGRQSTAQCRALDKISDERPFKTDPGTMSPRDLGILHKPLSRNPRCGFFDSRCIRCIRIRRHDNCPAARLPARSPEPSRWKTTVLSSRVLRRRCILTAHPRRVADVRRSCSTLVDAISTLEEACVVPGFAPTMYQSCLLPRNISTLGTLGGHGRLPAEKEPVG